MTLLHLLKLLRIWSVINTKILSQPLKNVVSKRETTSTRTLLEQHWDKFRQITSCSRINNDNRLHIHNDIPPLTKPISSPNNDRNRIPYIVHNKKDTTTVTNATSPSNNATTAVQSFIDNIKDTQYSPPSSPVQDLLDDLPPLRDLPRVQQVVENQYSYNSIAPYTCLSLQCYSTCWFNSWSH